MINVRVSPAHVLFKSTGYYSQSKNSPHGTKILRYFGEATSMILKKAYNQSHIFSSKNFIMQGLGVLMHHLGSDLGEHSSLYTHTQWTPPFVNFFSMWWYHIWVPTRTFSCNLPEAWLVPSDPSYPSFPEVPFPSRPQGTVPFIVLYYSPDESFSTKPWCWTLVLSHSLGTWFPLSPFLYRMAVLVPPFPAEGAPPFGRDLEVWFPLFPTEGASHNQVARQHS